MLSESHGGINNLAIGISIGLLSRETRYGRILTYLCSRVKALGEESEIKTRRGIKRNGNERAIALYKHYYRLMNLVFEYCEHAELYQEALTWSAGPTEVVEEGILDYG